MVHSSVWSIAEGNAMKLVSSEITSSIECEGTSRCAVGKLNSKRFPEVPPILKVRFIELVTTPVAFRKSSNKSRDLDPVPSRAAVSSVK